MDNQLIRKNSLSGSKKIHSPTSIQVYKQCPRKYYYQYILGLEVLPNIHQIRGKIAHAVLEKFFDLDPSLLNEKNFEEKLKKRIQDLFFLFWKLSNKELKELKLSLDQEKFYFEETLLMLMNWVNHFIERIKETNLPVGEAFQKLIPIREEEIFSERYAVHGFIDVIHQLENEIHLIDYKTSSSLEIKDDYRLQLAIYSLLYYEKYGRKPDKAGIFFLRHKLKLIKVDEELMELAKREIELIHQKTESDLVDDYPKKIGPLCKWASGQCDFYPLCYNNQKNS